MQILENIETAEKQREQSEKNLKEFDEIILKSKNKAKEVMLAAREKIFSEITKKKTKLDEDLSSEIQIVEKEGLLQQSDPKKLEKIILDVLSKNQDKVIQYKSGKEKLFGYFVGEVMKISKGKANPQLVNEILKKKLH